MTIIAARTTAPSRGAIAVVEVVGAGAAEIVGGLFDQRLPPPGKTTLGRLVDGAPIDEVLLRIIPASESFTGEETAEICCHGGSAVVESVLEALARRGVKRVEANDLLRRAVETGRIDPIREEAYRLLPTALTEPAARMLLDQAQGALSRALQEGQNVLSSAALGIALTSPHRIVLAGRPNAGKSTLFNALVEEDRVIVSDEPGTTRDPVREFIAIEGVPFQLCDTAGVEEGRKLDLLEMLSEKRTHEEILAADLVIFLHDATIGVRPDEGVFLAQLRRPALRVANKSEGSGGAPGLRISAETGMGLDGLRAGILRMLGIVPGTEPGRPMIFTRRQKELIEEGRGMELLQSS